MLPIQWRYWTATGWSSPRSARIPSRAARVASGPARVATGSPGTIRITRKIMTDASSSTRTADGMRRTRYRLIRSPVQPRVTERQLAALGPAQPVDVVGGLGLQERRAELDQEEVLHEVVAQLAVRRHGRVAGAVGELPRGVGVLLVVGRREVRGVLVGVERVRGDREGGRRVLGV